MEHKNQLQKSRARDQKKQNPNRKVLRKKGDKPQRRRGEKRIYNEEEGKGINMKRENKCKCTRRGMGLMG